MLRFALDLHLVLFCGVEMEAGATIELVEHDQVEVVLGETVLKVDSFVLVAVWVDIASLFFLVGLILIISLFVPVLALLLVFLWSSLATFLIFLFFIVTHFVAEMLLIYLFVFQDLGKYDASHQGIVASLMVVRAQICAVVV